MKSNFATLFIKSSNERSGVDAGRPRLFAFGRRQPGTTHREC
jgi:hypothetical protein